jgi:hypothetical protein
MMLDCQTRAQSIKPIVTAATTSANPNCDSVAGTLKRRSIRIIGLPPRTHKLISIQFTRPSCKRWDDFQVAASYEDFGKRMAKSPGKLAGP